MKLSLLTSAALAALLAAGMAQANDPASKTTTAGAPPSFASLDKNADGRISAAEARADKNLDRDFSVAASDSSRGISQVEYDRWVASQKAAKYPATTPTERPQPPM